MITDENSDLIHFEDLTLFVKSTDFGGKHYNGRGHVEEYHSHAYEYLRRVLDPIVCVDIGSNYGFTAMLMRRAFPKAKLTLVEPIPWLQEYARHNFEANNLNFDEYISGIASDAAPEQTKTTFGERINRSQDSRVIPPPGAKTIETQQTSIDAILRDVRSEDSVYIKIDTQGWEPAVFRGGNGFLNRHKNWLIKTEFGPHWLESQGENPKAFLHSLTNRFKVFEAPARTPWMANSLREITGQEVKYRDVDAFTTYVRKLNRDDQGWVDLFVMPKRIYHQMNWRRLLSLR